MNMETPSAEAPDASAEAMLIDRYLPSFQATQIEHLVVDADIGTTWAALVDLDLLDVHSPPLDAAFFVRGLPARVMTRLGRTPAGGDTGPTALRLWGIDEHDVEGWLPLGERPGREVAFGAIGRFWKPNIEWYDVTTMTAEQFAAFDEPGWGKIAANFSLRQYGAERTLVSYEARTATSDRDSAQKFARYWSLIRPFVGYVERAALATVRRDAEQVS